MVISSEIPFTAFFSTLSASPSASLNDIRVSLYTSHSFSLFTMSIASTFLLSSSTPFKAFTILRLCSK